MNLEISQFPMNRPAATFGIFIMRKRAAPVNTEDYERLNRKTTVVISEDLLWL